MMQTREIKRTLRKVERLFGLRRGWLAKIAQIESAMNPKALNPHSGAAGLFQFLKGTAREENINPYDVLEASVATAKRLRRFRETYARFGEILRDQADELTVYYLSHQQGVKGIQQILESAAVAVPLSDSRIRNMKANIHGDLMGDSDRDKAQFFLAFWDRRLASA